MLGVRPRDERALCLRASYQTPIWNVICVKHGAKSNEGYKYIVPVR